MSKYYIASDHTALEFKNSIYDYLKSEGCQIEDLGTHALSRVNYTDFAKKLCETIVFDSSRKGILICGTGIGMSIMANKINGIRAALCTNEYMAKMSVVHNNANVLCLGVRVLGVELAKSIISAYMSSQFEGGRHQQRINHIEQLGTKLEIG